MVVYAVQLYKPLSSLKANSNFRFESEIVFCYSSSLIVVWVKMGHLLSKNPSDFVLLSFLNNVPLNLYVKEVVVKKVNNNPYVKEVVVNNNRVSLVARIGRHLNMVPLNCFFEKQVPLNLIMVASKKVNNNPYAKKLNHNQYVKKVNNNKDSLVARTGRHLQRYDTVGYRQVVGCIPYRYSETEANKSVELEVLVISSQKGEGMLFPKGGWEMDEDKKAAALRETFEEAGVRGVVEEELGMWPYKSKRCDIMHNGYMFPLRVNEQLDHWPEQNSRQRKWMTATEAREVCQQGWMKEALNEFIRQRMKNSDK